MLCVLRGRFRRPPPHGPCDLWLDRLLLFPLRSYPHIFSPSSLHRHSHSHTTLRPLLSATILHLHDFSATSPACSATSSGRWCTRMVAETVDGPLPHRCGPERPRTRSKGGANADDGEDATQETSWTRARNRRCEEIEPVPEFLWIPRRRCTRIRARRRAEADLDLHEGGAVAGLLDLCGRRLPHWNSRAAARGGAHVRPASLLHRGETPLCRRLYGLGTQ